MQLDQINSLDSESQTTDELLTFSETMNLIHSRKQLKIEAIDKAALNELETQIENRLSAKFSRDLARSIFAAEEKVRQVEKLNYKSLLFFVLEVF